MDILYNVFIFTSLKPKKMKIKTVQQILKNIPNINYGGCGISALAMYLWIQKYEGIIPKIVFCYRTGKEDSYSNNKKSIKEGRVTLEVPPHVAIIYKGKRYDSEGMVIKGKVGWGGYIFSRFHQVKINELINTINRTHDWNDSFDRDKNIPIIENILGIELPIYK